MGRVTASSFSRVFSPILLRFTTRASGRPEIRRIRPVASFMCNAETINGLQNGDNIIITARSVTLVLTHKGQHNVVSTVVGFRPFGVGTWSRGGEFGVKCYMTVPYGTLYGTFVTADVQSACYRRKNFIESQVRKYNEMAQNGGEVNVERRLFCISKNRKQIGRIHRPP